MLENEATRQRALDAAFIGMVFGGSDTKDMMDSIMKIHGPYTEGFYEQEFNALTALFGG